MIRTILTPATSRYGSHMGTCEHFPTYAEAWEDGKQGRVEITSLQYPNLTDAQLVEKAVAMFRARCRAT